MAVKNFPASVLEPSQKCRMVYLSETPPRNDYQLFSSLPDVMPCKDAAKALGICEKKIREMARTGELQGIKIGSAWRFPKTSLINYVNGVK
ncbi:MAG: helix-turn-helix domain-containing protein [Acinetobacter sp.]